LVTVIEQMPGSTRFGISPQATGLTTAWAGKGAMTEAQLRAWIANHHMVRQDVDPADSILIKPAMPTSPEDNVTRFPISGPQGPEIERFIQPENPIPNVLISPNNGPAQPEIEQFIPEKPDTSIMRFLNPVESVPILGIFPPSPTPGSEPFDWGGAARQLKPSAPSTAATEMTVGMMILYAIVIAGMVLPSSRRPPSRRTRSLPSGGGRCH
jgi:hypothetical protein